MPDPVPLQEAVSVSLREASLTVEKRPASAPAASPAKAEFGEVDPATFGAAEPLGRTGNSTTLSAGPMNGIDDATRRGLAGLLRTRDRANDISDLLFMRDLKTIKSLRSFMLQEAVNTTGGNAYSFGSLNSLRYSVSGRDPTSEEWEAVETLTGSLFSSMTEPLRRKFLLGNIPWWVAGLPLVFALVALLSLVFAILSPSIGWLKMSTIGATILPYYLLWLMSLGAIGSVSFIGMNALSIQSDATFDLNNQRLTVLRIALGALFALVLTLPFGFHGFVEFCNSIANANGAPESSVIDKSVVTESAKLLMPFVLGFSTTLVILVMNRLVEAVQSFFGGSTGAKTTQLVATTSITPDMMPRK